MGCTRAGLAGALVSLGVKVRGFGLWGLSWRRPRPCAGLVWGVGGWLGSVLGVGGLGDLSKRGLRRALRVQVVASGDSADTYFRAPVLCRFVAWKGAQIRQGSSRIQTPGCLMTDAMERPYVRHLLSGRVIMEAHIYCQAMAIVFCGGNEVRRRPVFASGLGF